jgi:hypothetical protein
MKRFFMSLTMLAAISSLLVIQAVAFSSASGANMAPALTGGSVLNMPITTGANAGNLLSGTFKVTRFVAKKGRLSAIGDFIGTITDAAGNLIGDPINIPNVEIPILLPGSNATCDILNLDLGPLDLDVLGLVVELSDIQLDITAEAGPGNLLGNLLCAVAGLLDRGGPVNGLAGLLNNILRILG